MELDFGLEKSASPRMLNWKADVKLAGAASRSEIFGRKISKADLTISATPKVAVIKGTANIDGLSVELDASEPLKAGDESLRSRVIRTRLTHKELAELGVNIDPIIRGTMAVEIVSQRRQSGLVQDRSYQC